MKVSKKIESEVLKLYDTWMCSYLSADLQTYGSYFDKDYHFIGSTNNEEFLNRKDTTQFFADTGDQFAGKTELRNETKTFEKFGELIFITHVFDAWFLNGKEWVFYSRFRFSSTLRENKEGWRFIYQHFSIPDAKAEEGDTIGYNKINEENQELREAINRRTVELEAKNRELEIEGALGRIRAQAVAMKESLDLLDIVVTMRTEFIKLGHEAHYFWHMMWLPATYEKAMTSGDGTKIGFVMELPRHIHGDIPLLSNWEKSNKPIIIYPMDTITALAYVDKMVTMGNFQHIDPQAPSEDDIRHIGGLTFIMARTTHGEIGYSLPGVVKNPPKEDLEILEKFAGAFDLAHRRFLDLKKAEKQAREVEIELGLEKVRSRSLAMRTSDELREAGALLFIEITKLGIESITSGYVILEEDNKIGWNYMPNPSTGKILPEAIGVYHDKTDIMRSITKNWKKQNPLFVVEMNEEQTITHQTFIAEQSINFHITAEQLIEVSPPELKLHNFNFKQGYLLIVGGTRLTSEQEEMMLRFTKVFQQTYTRFLDLQKAEAQAQEAKIEASLEKVRNVALTLKKSDDMLDIAQVLYEQLLVLGFTEIRNAIIDIHNDDNETLLDYDYSHDMSSAVTELSFYGDPVIEQQIKKVQSSNDAFFEIELKGKELEELIDTRLRNGEKEDPRLRKIDQLTYNLYSFGNGAIGISNFGILSDDQKTILKRFRNVFTFAYKRYTDLAKAEAQALEAQIEAALEKVRSVALILKKSEDMLEVAQALYEQLLVLGFANIRNSIIDIDNNDSTTFLDYDYSHEMGGTVTLMSYKDDPTLKEQLEDIIATTDGFSEMVLEGQQLQDLIEMRRNNGEEDDPRLLKTVSLSYVLYAFGNGAIGISNFGVLTINQKAILDRFRNVFTYAYKRYTDLRISEEQAREAQIEAALEKVRSRSLAMHQPDELQEVVAVVAEKLQELGVIFDAGGVILCTYFPDNKDVMHWIAVPDFSSSGSYFVPYFDNPIFSEAWDSKNRGDAFFSKEFTVEDKNHFFEYAFEHSDYKYFPDEYKNHVLQAEKHHLSAAWSKNSAIIIPSLTGVFPSESDTEIMKRFAKVFEQAYIRFMDLQKAEKRARENQIDIALERVRSRTMGMQKSDELAETSAVLFQQIKEIATETWSCGFCIWQENDEVELWMGADSGGILPPMLIPYKKEPTHKDIYEASLRKEPEYNKVWKGKALKDHYAFLRTIPSVAKAIKVMEDSGLTLPEQQCYYVGFFKHGYLLLITKEPNEDLVELSKRFTKVFDLTYTRFLDLQLKEKQSVELLAEKKRLETTLSDLQATQKQLIQSEKMASLGELTAGIAHEIQNPLNFVNNFSEVSNELIDEMNEEIKKGDMEEAKAISLDIKQNLEKINHHGKRADAIVKGMLQHSRKSTAEKIPTDINNLADEYLRLAYHGLRAKDKTFNATLKTDFDESIGLISIIPQDIGRVILNLITNAFYACVMRSRNVANKSINASVDESFKPTVSVSTKKQVDRVIISVKDNGNGIPKHVVDKIFQPFFTTKPTGEGTGLGLSMSYDIITKGHQGELKVETIENEGTTFRIELPIVTT